MRHEPPSVPRARNPRFAASLAASLASTFVTTSTWAQVTTASSASEFTADTLPTSGAGEGTDAPAPDVSPWEGRWCGPQGQWTSLLIPDEWPGACNAYSKPARFHVACRAHDGCYSTPGAPRETCDDAFLAGLERACDDAFHTWVCAPTRAECRGVARVYHAAVERFGRDAYDRAQRGEGLR